MPDLRADLVAALRDESHDLGCAGVAEADRIADALDRVADRIEQAGPVCICGPDSTGEGLDERHDCPVHGGFAERPF